MGVSIRVNHGVQVTFLSEERNSKPAADPPTGNDGQIPQLTVSATYYINHIGSG